MFQKSERDNSNLQDGFQDASVAFCLSPLFLVHRLTAIFQLNLFARACLSTEMQKKNQHLVIKL